MTCGRSVVYSGYSGFLHQWTDIHDIPEILVKVALNTITLTSEIVILLNLDLDNLIIWDEVPTMVEIAIFSFQIHITNGLNFMHRKWYTGNQYMVKSAENRMRNNLELFPVINVKRRPRYIAALKKKSSPIYRCPKNLYTILMHWMSVKLADNFQIREHSWPCLFQ